MKCVCVCGGGDSCLTPNKAAEEIFDLTLIRVQSLVVNGPCNIVTVETAS